jgi:hypothetical protein
MMRELRGYALETASRLRLLALFVLACVSTVTALEPAMAFTRRVATPRKSQPARGMALRRRSHRRASAARRRVRQLRRCVRAALARQSGLHCLSVVHNSWCEIATGLGVPALAAFVAFSPIMAARIGSSSPRPTIGT